MVLRTIHKIYYHTGPLTVVLVVKVVKEEMVVMDLMVVVMDLMVVVSEAKEVLEESVLHTVYDQVCHRIYNRYFQYNQPPHKGRWGCKNNSLSRIHTLLLYTVVQTYKNYQSPLPP